MCIRDRDCAENAPAAIRDLGIAAADFLPHCKFTLRDVAHELRRVLTRPWEADKNLNQLVGMLFMDRDSIGQIIQHSRELSKLTESAQKLMQACQFHQSSGICEQQNTA